MVFRRKDSNWTGRKGRPVKFCRPLPCPSPPSPSRCFACSFLRPRLRAVTTNNFGRRTVRSKRRRVPGNYGFSWGPGVSLSPESTQNPVNGNLCRHGAEVVKMSREQTFAETGCGHDAVPQESPGWVQGIRWAYLMCMLAWYQCQPIEPEHTPNKEQSLTRSPDPSHPCSHSRGQNRHARNQERPGESGKLRCTSRPSRAQFDKEPHLQRSGGSGTLRGCWQHTGTHTAPDYSRMGAGPEIHTVDPPPPSLPYLNCSF